MAATDSGRHVSDTTARERMLSMVAGGLGILMFLLGFLKWLSFGDGDVKSSFSGFAFEMPTTAIIGLSLAAGLIALLGALERRRGRGVPSAIPTGLAAAGLLMAIGVFLGKGSISPSRGSEVGVEIGLILGLLTAAAQTAVLAMVLASRHDDHDHDHDNVRDHDARGRR